VNHPALVKTSNEPSFNSVNFSPFTSAEALRASDISAVPSLNLQPNPHGGTANKITNSSYRNFVGTTQKNRPLNPKPIDLVRMLFLVLQKDRREGLPGLNSVWHSIRFRHWPKCSFRWRFDKRRGTRRWLCVLYWSFLWRPQCRRVETMCEIFQMGAHTLCWYGGRFCLWDLSRINTVLFFLYVWNF